MLTDVEKRTDFMVKLNQRAKEYMEKFGWQHILLTVEADVPLPIGRYQ